MSLVLLNLQSNQQIVVENETPVVLGRGNVTGCSDKRVSRSHLRITYKDGKLNLVPLHTNPCFFTRNGVPPVHQLFKNEEETLKEGDCLGLLPNAFWFLVTSKETVKIKLEKFDSGHNCETNQTSESNCETDQVFKNNVNAIIEKSVEAEKDSETTNCKSVNETVTVSPKAGNSNCVTDSNSETPTKQNTSNTFYSPEFQKTRRLPLWMYEIDDPVEVTKNTVKRTLSGTDNKIKKKPKVSKGKKNTGNVTSEDSEVKIHATDLNLPSTSVVVQKDTSKSTSESGDTLLCQNFTGEQNKQSSKTTSGSGTNDFKRPICQYEGNCYRQNPNHKQSFSHPGDPDFVSYEDRPMCEYGAACYRKNQKHRIECRHPPTSESVPSSPSSQSDLGEERPPCMYGSSCNSKNRQHRKDYYHPPMGYKCYYGLGLLHPSADQNSSDSVSIASSYEWKTDPTLSDLDAFSSDDDWMYVGCDEDYYYF